MKNETGKKRRLKRTMVILGSNGNRICIGSPLYNDKDTAEFSVAALYLKNRVTGFLKKGFKIQEIVQTDRNDKFFYV